MHNDVGVSVVDCDVLLGEGDGFGESRFCDRQVKTVDVKWGEGMLFLFGNVGEPIGYVFCVFPLVEFCLRPDFRVYTVENLLADFTEFAFCGVNKAAGWVVGEVVLVVF